MTALLTVDGDSNRAAHLPEPARSKFEELHFTSRAANAVVRTLAEEMATERLELQRAEGRLRELQSGRWHQSEQATSQVESDIARRRDTIARLQRRYDEAAERWKALNRPLTTIENYLRDIGDVRSLTIAPPVEARLLKSEMAPDALNRIRAKIDELHVELQMVETAPFPSAVVKAKMRAQIAAMAEAGAPDVMAAIEGGGPVQFKMQNTIAPAVIGDNGKYLGSARVPAEIAAAPLMAWMFKDSLIAKVEAEIDKNSDDASAMDDSTRAKKIGQVKDAILAAEREEEALIELCHSHGLMVARREAADPRAVLGVVGPEVKDRFR